jgi:hypothetical protein
MKSSVSQILKKETYSSIGSLSSKYDQIEYRISGHEDKIDILKQLDKNKDKKTKKYE